LAVTATMLCYESATRAQAGTAFDPVEFTACQPPPPWYPRGWELMVRYPSVTYVPGTSYYSPTTPTLTPQPTRANECRFTLYTGSIAGHICVPAGGGEDAVEPSSPKALLQLLRRWATSLSRRHWRWPSGQPWSVVREPDLQIRRRRILRSPKP